jgi:hypothetical protein
VRGDCSAQSCASGSDHEDIRDACTIRCHHLCLKTTHHLL